MVLPARRKVVRAIKTYVPVNGDLPRMFVPLLRNGRFDQIPGLRAGSVRHNPEVRHDLGLGPARPVNEPENAFMQTKSIRSESVLYLFGRLYLMVEILGKIAKPFEQHALATGIEVQFAREFLHDSEHPFRKSFAFALRKGVGGINQQFSVKPGHFSLIKAATIVRAGGDQRHGRSKCEGAGMSVREGFQLPSKNVKFFPCGFRGEQIILSRL